MSESKEQQSAAEHAPPAGKPEVRLEHWSKRTIGVGVDVLLGQAYGHPRFPYGTDVRTSQVLKIEGNRAETLNTIYILGQPYMPEAKPEAAQL